MIRQYPINAGCVVFGEPVSTKAELDQQLAQLNDIITVAQDHNATLTILLSGPFADRAFTEGHAFFFTGLVGLGHEVGTYVVPYCRVAANVWTNVSNQIALFPETEPRNDSLRERVWEDNKAAVDALVGFSQNKTVHTLAFNVTEEESLVTRHSFDNTFATRKGVGLSYIGHPIHHPFRPELSDYPWSNSKCLSIIAEIED